MLCDHDTLTSDWGTTMILERVPSYLIAPTPGDRAGAVSVKIGGHYFEFDTATACEFMVGLGHAIHEREVLDTTTNVREYEDDEPSF